MSSLGSPVQDRHGRTGGSGAEVPKWSGAQQLREVSLFSLKKARKKGDFVAVYHCLMGGYRQDGTRLFLEMHRHKLEHEKTQGEKFHHCGSEILGQESKGMSRIPILEHIQKASGQGLEQPALNWPHFELWLGWRLPDFPSKLTYPVCL